MSDRIKDSPSKIQSAGGLPRLFKCATPKLTCLPEERRVPRLISDYFSNGWVNEKAKGKFRSLQKNEVMFLAHVHL